MSALGDGTGFHTDFVGTVRVNHTHAAAGNLYGVSGAYLVDTVGMQRKTGCFNAVYSDRDIFRFRLTEGKEYSENERACQKYGEKEVDFIAKRQSEKIYIQVSYILATPETVEREFGVYRNIRDNYPKYVLSLDEFNMSRDGIIHQNIRNFLLEGTK